MLGIIMSRGFRRYAINFNLNVDRPPLRCYASGWWKELFSYGIYDVCDCKVWCKYPVSKKLNRY